MQPRLRMFAGPNGSGKSTVIRHLQSLKRSEWFGHYINADDIEREIRDTGKVSCNLEVSDLIQTVTSHSQWLKQEKAVDLELGEGFISVIGEISSYGAAALADIMREYYLENNLSFSFETVMSHPSKVDILRRAKEQGYRTYLYFVSTWHPDINVERVAIRVSQGEHDVEESKIRDRYFRSLLLLKDAAMIVDRAYIFDNSGEAHRFVLEISQGVAEAKEDTIPNWVNLALWEDDY